MRRFAFADAFWFRVPAKVVVITVTSFALVTIWPALTDGTPHEQQRAMFALAAVVFFVSIATTFAVAINDSYIELGGETLFIRFEAFFTAEVPISEIVAIREIDPRPRWRFRFGLSTDLRDRICCSHGGRLIEIELRHAWRSRIWPRHIAVRRFWVAVRDHDAFLDALRAQVGTTAPPTTEARRHAA
jgi:hypothetical protein